MSFLEVRGLVAGYGQSVIVRDLSLSVDAGEAVAIVGKNGAGKSTLVNSLFGGTRIRAGTIHVGGVELTGLPPYAAPRLGVSVSPQGRLILPHLTIRENLLLGAASRRPGAWTLDRVFELFPVLGTRAGAMGHALSGGQQQMLAVGRALLANPRVLVLDEPSEGLSPLLVDVLVAIFNRILETGTGILVVEQHMGLVRRFAQRFAVMSKGAVLDAGRVDEIDADKHAAAFAI